MSQTNKLDKIMHDLELSCADVAHELNVPLETVEDWASPDRGKRAPMPESELRLLRYSLISENPHYFLF